MSRLHIKSDLSQLPSLYAFCEEEGIDDKALLVLEEAIVNIASHSNASYIDLAYEHSDKSQTFVIEDDGIMFDPTAFTPCDDNAEKLALGGQGIRIIRSMTDDMQYKRIDGKNILILTKHK